MQAFSSIESETKYQGLYVSYGSDMPRAVVTPKFKKDPGMTA
jgi:hypothetical protein